MVSVHLRPRVARPGWPSKPMAAMDADPPPPAPFAEILVCQAGSCRDAGSEAVILEIEELARSVGQCNVEASGCLGACGQAPNVLVVKGRQEQLCTKVDAVEKSAAAVEQATGRRPSLGDPAVVERLSDARQMRIRSRAREEGKWNGALAGMAEQVARAKGSQRLQLLFEQSQLLASAGLWEEALDGLTQVESRIPRNLPIMLERAGLLGKLGRKEDLDALEQVVSGLPLDDASAIQIMARLAKCRADPAAGLDASRRPIENYATWRLESVTQVSKHSAIFRFASGDRARATPNPRGRGRTVWHKTWHTTLLAQVGPNGEGPLPWVERDYTPISTAKDWEQGRAELLVKVYGAGLATSWLLGQPLGSQVRLSKPARTLHVPSLVEDLSRDEIRRPASVLLLLAGSGIVVAPQVLHHASAATCFGPHPVLTQPVGLIYSCREDDVCMAAELAAWCGSGRLRRCLLLLTEPQRGAPAPFPGAECADLEGLAAQPRARRLRARLSRELLEAEWRAMEGPCRVVVSGPASFNAAAGEMLGQIGVPAEARTVLSA
uniref:FAD-binding FR-type domain-containing protein n=1 Tax=Alexandrium monilatum TaxID=311494 RepID=A0A7S4WEY5_9DINO